MMKGTTNPEEKMRREERLLYLEVEEDNGFRRNE